MKIHRILITTLCMTPLFIHAQATTPKPIFPPDKVLASNQYVKVTYEDFEAEMARIPARDQYEFLLDRQRLGQLIDNILLNKTLALEARENKLQEQPKVKAEINNQIDKVLAKHRGQQVQNEAPKLNHLARAREDYLANPEKYTQPAQYELWHVMISIIGRSREQAKARAEEVRQKLIAGEPREALARNYSDDQDAKLNGGNLGASMLSKFNAEFAQGIQNLRAGEVSKIIETSYGVHVAKVLEYIPPKKVPFDVIKNEIVADAENKYLLSIWERHLQKIQNDPKLFVDVEALDAIRPKITPPPVPQPSQDKPAAAKK